MRSLGRATCTWSLLTHWASWVLSAAMSTSMRREFGFVPHHLGLARNTMPCAVTLAIRNGPPERSMAGFTVVQAGFHPVFSMMCAGNRSEKSISQSANGVRKITVTVRPLSLPFTERMSRYPAVLATVVGSDVGSPRCCVQA